MTLRKVVTDSQFATGTRCGTAGGFRFVSDWKRRSLSEEVLDLAGKVAGPVSGDVKQLVALRAQLVATPPQDDDDRRARAAALRSAGRALRHVGAVAVPEIPDVLDTPLRNRHGGRGGGRGRTPYGLQSRHGRRTPNPDEVAVIARIHRWKRRGVSDAEVARRLEDAKVRAPGGGLRWHGETVRRITRRGTPG